MTTSDAPVTSRVDVLGTRVVAAIIDLILLFVLFVVMAVLFGDSKSDTSKGVSIDLQLNGGPFLLYLLLTFGYFFVTEAYLGGTIGKKVMGLKVVGGAGPPSTAAIAIRNLVRFIDMLPFFYLIGFVVAATRSDRRRLGDIVAGTDVVRT